jgi:hypothetical protein
MRSLAAACLVGVALVIAGCGVDKDPGQIAVTTIEDDWEGFYVVTSDPFPTRPDLAGKNTIRDIKCDPKTNAAGRLQCTLVVGPGSAGPGAKVVHVAVHFDAQGTLREWKFTG